jgi:hypothetical protein
VLVAKSPLIRDLARWNVEAEVMHANRIAIVGDIVPGGAFLTQAQRGEARPLDREVVDRLTLLAARLAQIGPADRLKQPAIERQASRDRTHHEVHMADLRERSFHPRGAG